jgi:hypothetical protein
VLGGCRDHIDSLVEGGTIVRGWLTETAHLAHVLKGCGSNVVLAHVV